MDTKFKQKQSLLISNLTYEDDYDEVNAIDLDKAAESSGDDNELKETKQMNRTQPSLKKKDSESKWNEFKKDREKAKFQKTVT